MAGLAREEEVRQPQDGGRGPAAGSLAPASPAQPQAGLQPGQRENISQQQKIFSLSKGVGVRGGGAAGLHGRADRVAALEAVGLGPIRCRMIVSV